MCHQKLTALSKWPCTKCTLANWRTPNRDGYQLWFDTPTIPITAMIWFEREKIPIITKNNLRFAIPNHWFDLMISNLFQISWEWEQQGFKSVLIMSVVDTSLEGWIHFFSFIVNLLQIIYLQHNTSVNYKYKRSQRPQDICWNKSPHWGFYNS